MNGLQSGNASNRGDSSSLTSADAFSDAPARRCSRSWDVQPSGNRQLRHQQDRLKLTVSRLDDCGQIVMRLEATGRA